MTEEMRMWLEVSFNILYLIAVWILVVAMIRRQPQVPPGDQPLTKLFIWAFALLALGDTGHVGFRVLAYAQGDLESTISIAAQEIGLVGLGALSTSITVTGITSPSGEKICVIPIFLPINPSATSLSPRCF